MVPMNKDKMEVDGIREEPRVVQVFNQAVYRREMIVEIPTDVDQLRVVDLETGKPVQAEVVVNLREPTKSIFIIYALIELDGLELRSYAIETGNMGTGAAKKITGVNWDCSNNPLEAYGFELTFDTKCRIKTASGNDTDPLTLF